MRTAPQAIAAAKASHKNVKGMCQNWTWNLFQSHSVGDVDHDGDSDAVDGWKSEPVSARHTDRRPWIGSPIAFSGGSGGFGHRCICIGYSKNEPLFRSTDANGSTNVADRTLSWFEINWHLKYLGWSTTISGQPISGLVAPPGAPKAKPKPKPHAKSRGTVVDKLVVDIKKAKKGTGARAKQLTIAQKALNAVPYIGKK